MITLFKFRGRILTYQPSEGDKLKAVENLDGSIPFDFLAYAGFLHNTKLSTLDEVNVIGKADSYSQLQEKYTEYFI
jgi:hypothetical protein